MTRTYVRDYGNRILFEDQEYILNNTIDDSSLGEGEFYDSDEDEDIYVYYNENRFIEAIEVRRAGEDMGSFYSL